MQGLALPALAKDAWQMPAFFRMVQLGLLRDPVFSVWMDPNAAAVPAGEILFGGADATHFDGHLATVPVISKKWAPAKTLCTPSCLMQSMTALMHAAVQQ